MARVEEPLPPDHPLRRLENTVITPHLGYVTVETYRVNFSQAVEDILAFLNGKPTRVLKPPLPAPPPRGGRGREGVRYQPRRIRPSPNIA